MELTDKEIAQYKAILLNFVPKDGTAIGNMNARFQLIQQINQEFGKTISEDNYWTIRNGLMADGKITKGPGKGGSIFRVSDIVIKKQPESISIKRSRESDLYSPIYKIITEWWVEVYAIEDFICQNTANQGKKDTGGPWTRPDLSLFAVRTYPYNLPRKMVELITFEIKPFDSSPDKYVAGVFETASHHAFAHRSYLMVNISKEQEKDPRLDRLEKEAQRMKVGFVTFEDATKWETYDVKVEAVLQQPDPADLCKFIIAQFNQKEKEGIYKILA